MVDEKILDSVILYLSNNPKIEYNPYPQYEGIIYQGLGLLGFDNKYLKNHEKLKENIDEYSIKDIKTILSFIERGEKFCDGHIASYIEDGSLLKIFLRLKKLNSR